MVVLANAAGPAKETAVDAALGGGAEADASLGKLEEKVARNPSMRRRHGESLEAWTQRIGVFFLLNDKTTQRRLMMRDQYTVGQLNLSSDKTAELAKWIESASAEQIAERILSDMTQIEAQTQPASAQPSQDMKALAPYDRAPSGQDPILAVQPRRV